MKVSGYSALVTGGGSGMGEATARALAAEGAKVSILDVQIEAARKVADEINGLAVECDVTDAGSVEIGVAQARDAHGAARICVNCAGIATAKRIVGRDGPMPLEQFTRVINVNLNGTFNVLRIAAADMQTLGAVGESGERGVIVNTASVAAYEGQIGQAAYSASKGGVVALTLPAAREFASTGIRVLTIAPGLIATPMLYGLPEEAQKSLAEQVPFPRRLGRPDEFSSLVLHIIGNEMLNGEVIRLDGAIRLAPR
ncbi:MAG: SDR family NAD(P)-dependent oxidoreductase [Gammaproteobacteria bacterium]|nr:SDR family NAD(P)-dependent oxidoreductase [Gammaproteobacteria bacterium]